MREWRLGCALCAVAVLACNDPGPGADGGADAAPDAPSDAGQPLPSFACADRSLDAPLGEPVILGMEASAAPSAPEGVRLRGRFLTPGRIADAPEGLAFVFVDPALRSAALAALRDRVVHRVARGLYVVRGGSFAGVPGVRGVEPMIAADRLDPRVVPGPVDVIRPGDPPRIERIDADAATLARLAADPDVLLVEPGFTPRPTLDWQRRSVRANRAQRLEVVDGIPRYGGLTGAGVVAALTDTGVDGDHPDFRRYDDAGTDLGTRVEGEGPIDDQSHGTTVAGIMAGSGHASAGQEVRGEVGGPFQWRGIAPGVERIASTPLDYGRHPLLTSFLDHGAHLSNHSHTLSNGDYSGRVAGYDYFVREGANEVDGPWAPPRPVIFAGANNGRRASSGDSTVMGYYAILAPPKNPITVGGTIANDDQYAASASCGPTLDGRLKPDLVAPGYKDHRPPNGVALSLFEVRLHATEGSGVADRVWTPGSTDPDWALQGAFETAVIEAGALTHRSLGSLRDRVQLRPTDPIDTTLYDRISVTMALDWEGDPERHRHPVFWVTRFDDGTDRTWRYPRFVTRERGATVTHEMDLGGDDRWAGSMVSVRVTPVVYDDRVHAPRPGGGYGGSGGTSLAAPVVSGAVALLMERFRELHGVDWTAAPLLPSTLKAFLVHTARDLVYLEPALRDPDSPDTGAPVTYGPGPDWSTGYGLLDIPEAVALVDAHAAAPRFVEGSIEGGQIHVYRVPVDPDGGPLRATLAWDDPMGSMMLAATEPQLVHDLDLIAVAPDGVGHGPWVIDLPPLASDPFAGEDPIAPEDVTDARRCAEPTYWAGDATAECENHRDNLEMVLVDAPAGGFWEIRVRAPELAEGPQRYSLVVSQRCTP